MTMRISLLNAFTNTLYKVSATHTIHIIDLDIRIGEKTDTPLAQLTMRLKILISYRSIFQKGDCFVFDFPGKFDNIEK